MKNYSNNVCILKSFKGFQLEIILKDQQGQTKRQQKRRSQNEAYLRNEQKIRYNGKFQF